MRGILAVLGVACAHMLGRTTAAARKDRQKKAKIYTWGIRTVACLVAMTIRHPVDIPAIGSWALAVLAFALGWWYISRERKDEDLTDTIFPHEQ